MRGPPGGERKFCTVFTDGKECILLSDCLIHQKNKGQEKEK